MTGHDAQGKAIITSDGEPPDCFESKIKGTFFSEIWNTKASPAPVSNGPDPTLGQRKMSPHANGSVIRIVQIAPEREVEFGSDPAALRAHFAELGSEEAATYDSNAPHPLMHRTESIDYGIVLEGEVTLILDDSETVLKAGDVVVQRGTNHAWSNRGDRPCRIAFILLDGRYPDEISQALVKRGAGR